jgi:hypothetical protein
MMFRVLLLAGYNIAHFLSSPFRACRIGARRRAIMLHLQRDAHISAENFCIWRRIA